MKLSGVRMEFALSRLRGWEEVHRVKWDSIIANGMLAVEKWADENAVLKALKESLTTKFPLPGANDFEFVKVRDEAV